MSTGLHRIIGNQAKSQEFSRMLDGETIHRPSSRAVGEVSQRRGTNDVLSSRDLDSKRPQDEVSCSRNWIMEGAYIPP